MGFERLENPTAEAQLDFGTMKVCHEGTFKDIKSLIMSYPNSNVDFAVALPSENQECLLEGMKELFNQAGGVPKKIRIDNMSTAVLKTKTRYQPAVLTDFKSFNQNLAKQLIDDRERLHYEKQKKIADLWKEEEANLLPLPEVDYPVFKEIQLKSNKYNEVKLDNEWIHVPRLKNHAIIYGILRYDSYQLISNDGEIIHEGFRPYMNKKRKIEWVSILKDWRRKPRSMHYSRYWKYLPERIKLYLSHPDWAIQDSRVDYCHYFVPSLPSFVPRFAIVCTTHCHQMYHIRKHPLSS